MTPRHTLFLQERGRGPIVFHGQDHDVARVTQNVDSIIVWTRRDVLAIDFNYRVPHEQLPSRVRRLFLVDSAGELRVTGLKARFQDAKRK